MTRSPGCFSTGIDSPVSIDSSTAPPPAVITPSTGMRSPGRTITRSPLRTSAIGTSMLLPSRRTRAVDGCSLRQLAQGPRRVALRARLHGVAEQHQRDDDDHRFVVHVRRGRRSRRTAPGANGRDHRIDERRAGADRDQRVHVRRCHGAGSSTRRRRSAGRPTPSRRPSRRAAAKSRRAGIDRIEPRQQPPHRRIEDAHRPRDERIARSARHAAPHQRHRGDHRQRAEDQADQRPW